MREALDALYGSLPLAVVLADDDYRVFYANPAFFTLTECTQDDLRLMEFRDVLSMYCLGLCGDISELLESSGGWRDIEKPVAMSDGGLAWVRVRTDLTPLPSGGVAHRLMVDNITRYKVAIEGLVNRKNLYQSIVETRPDLICCFLPDWSLTYANTAASRYFDMDRESILGQHFLLLLPSEVRELFGQAVDTITADNPIAELELRVDGDEEGRPLWQRWIIQGFFYRTGHIKDFQATGLDITDQKVTESQFMHADRLVSLGTLVSEVAHEISNPNNFIMLNAPLVLDLWNAVSPRLRELADKEPGAALGGIPVEDVTAHVPQLLGGIIEGSRRIRDFVRELKNFARQDIESGFEMLSVNDVVQTAVLLMSKTIGMHTSRFSVRYGAGLPPVRGRRHRLEQIVVNLVQNACHALRSPEQGIEIATTHDEESGSVRISVIDQGVGIPPQDIPRVTDPYYSTKREQGGTGLGLSISLSIAREHGGRLIIESEPGEGTTATIALPAAMQ
ncbi:PAS domain-containing sensor histidine kinase [Fundidesulfovibrio soli]|uniref:PAS domain-containing sensor histidine kinase n=1 Tax=Fundidesulfovibrio soli TaxID=2922716 RepID=UPI001FAE9C01|nr:ATP-binding protein [Fundidesulfovibrio soli]